MFNFLPGPTPQKPAPIRFSVNPNGQNVEIRFYTDDGRWFMVSLDADNASRLGAAILAAAGQIEPAIDWPEDIGE